MTFFSTDTEIYNKVTPWSKVKTKKQKHHIKI